MLKTWHCPFLLQSLKAPVAVIPVEVAKEIITEDTVIPLPPGSYAVTSRKNETIMLSPSELKLVSAFGANVQLLLKDCENVLISRWARMSCCAMKRIKVCVVVICVYYCYYHCHGHHCYHSHYYHYYYYLYQYFFIIIIIIIIIIITIIIIIYCMMITWGVYILSVSMFLHLPRYTVFKNFIPYFTVSYRTQSNNTRICAPRKDGEMQNIFRTMLHISLHRRMFRDRSVPSVSSIKNS